MGKYDSMFNGLQRVVDEEAFTIKDIARKMAVADSTARSFTRKMVEEGAWEQVWKRGPKGFIAAFRPTKKK